MLLIAKAAFKYKFEIFFSSNEIPMNKNQHIFICLCCCFWHTAHYNNYIQSLNLREEKKKLQFFFRIRVSF